MLVLVLAKEEIMSNIKDILVDVSIAFFGVLITMLFEFIAMLIWDKDRFLQLGQNPNEGIRILGVYSDLMVIAIGLIFGAYIKGKVEDRARLVPPLIGLVVALLLSIVISLLSLPFPANANWLRVWIP